MNLKIHTTLILSPSPDVKWRMTESQLKDPRTSTCQDSSAGREFDTEQGL